MYIKFKMTFGYQQTKKSLRKLESPPKRKKGENLLFWGLKKFDAFGQNVQFNIDGKNQEIKTPFGGIASLFVYISVFIYFLSLS